MTPHESETEKINRIYVTTLRDGWGDLGHFKDRATANMQLDEVFREQNPEFYILTINFEKRTDHEKTLSQIKDRLSTLPDAHPLNVSNLGKTFFIHHYGNKALSQEILTAEQISEFIKGPSIIHEISTKVDDAIFSNIKVASKGRLIEIHSRELNLGKIGVNKLKSIVNQGIGLGEDRAGLFLKKPHQLSESEILDSLNKEGVNHELIAAIFRVAHPGLLSLEDLKTFSESTLFVPAYVQSDEFFKKVVEYVSKSELARGKIVVFLVTGDKQYESPKDNPYNCQILNYTDRSIDEKTYSAVSNLENPYLSVCSGDKSFEAAISNRKIPLFQMYKKGHSKAAFYDHEFLAVLRKMPVAQEDTKAHGRLIEALSEFSRRDVADKKSDIDEEISSYWKTKCIPELHRYNFFKAVPTIENESVILHKIIYNGEIALAEKIDNTTLAITLFHLSFDKIAIIIDGISIERSKKIGAIISEAIRDMRLQEDTTALIVQALCSPQALEAYETGKIKAADLRIATIFRRDLDYSDHESIRRATDEAIKKIQILTSQEALTAYKNGYMQVSDLLQLSVQNICDLISPQAIQAYETGHVKFSNLQNFGSQIIKLLISPELLEIYRDSDVKIEDFIGFDAYRIETLTSPQALAAYKDGHIKIADFHKLKIDSMLTINDLISEGALYLYRTQKITVDCLISIGAKYGIKVLKLLSKEAINAYATGIVKITDLIYFGNDFIDMMISPRAIEAYRIGGESALAIIKEFGLDGESSAILLSPKAIELYTKGFLNIEADINTLTDDQIKAFFKSIENADIENKVIIDHALSEARTSCPQPTELSSQQNTPSFVRFFTVKYDNPILSDKKVSELLNLAQYYYPSKGMNKLIDIGGDAKSYEALQALRLSLGDEKAIELLMKAAKIGGDDLFNLVLNLLPEELMIAIKQQEIEEVLYRLLGKEVIKQEHHIKTEQGELKTLVSYLDRASGEILSSETKDTPLLKLDTQHTITHGFFSLLKTLYGATLAQVDSISEKAQELIQLIVDNLSPEQTDEEVGLLTFLYDLLGTLESGQDFSVPLPPRKNPDDGPGDFGWSSGGGLPDDSSDNGNFMMIGQAANTTGVDLDNRL